MSFTQHQTQQGDLLAVVANTGDSRLLADDGSSCFRQVTRDHRPQDALERQRLDACADAQVQLDTTSTTGQAQAALRLYPGGLAVSRTIGDVDLCPAAVPTPDVYRISLQEQQAAAAATAPTSNNNCQTIRFLLASDGLWDVLSNQDVGLLAAQRDSQGKHVSPAAAVDAVMKECLSRTGGHHDDTTVLVVDVKVWKQQKRASAG